MPSPKAIIMLQALTKPSAKRTSSPPGLAYQQTEPDAVSCRGPAQLRRLCSSPVRPGLQAVHAMDWPMC